MPSLKQRLLAVEQECFTAIVEGGETLTSFNARWEALVADIDAACDSNHLDGDLMTLIHVVSTRVATLVDTSVELFATCDSLTTDFVSHMEDLLAELSIKETSNPPLFPPSSQPASLSPKRRRSSDEQRDVESTKSPKRKRIASESANPSPPPPTRVSSLVVSSSPSPDIPEATPHARRHKSSTTTEPSYATTSRKRRRSDADGHMPRSAKRHHIGPRVHAVSDSFVRQPTSGQPSPQATNGVQSFSASLSTNLMEAPVSSPSLLSNLNIEGTIASSDGLEICSIWDKPHDPLSSLSDLPELDTFLQTFLDADPAPLSPSIPPMPFNDIGFSLDESVGQTADQPASSPESTSSLSSSPSSPSTPISPSSPSNPIVHVLSPPQYQFELPLGLFDWGESFSSCFPSFQIEGKMNTPESCGYEDILSTSADLAQLPLSRSWSLSQDLLDSFPSVDTPPPPYGASMTSASRPDNERSLPSLSLKTLACDWLEPVVLEGFVTKGVISEDMTVPFQEC